MANTTVAASLAYPLCVVDGRLVVSRNEDVVRDQILSVLETRPLERVMQPAYGTPDLVFEVHSSPGVIAERIRQTLLLSIADVAFTVTGVIEETGIYTLTIEYTINGQLQPTLTFDLEL